LLARAKVETTLVPPFDCEWVWHCHRLNPLHYAKDCERLHGKVLVTNAVPPAERNSALDVTAKLCEDAYPNEPFSLDLDVFCSSKSKT